VFTGGKGLDRKGTGMDEIFSTKGWKWTGLILGIFLAGFLSVASISVGVTPVPFETVIESFTDFQNTNEHLIVRTTRVPRTIIAVAVGASLAVAGAVMQALTRNPLASPSTLGVNQGAGLFIVLAVSLFSVTVMSTLMVMGFAGAAFAIFIVYILGSAGRDGMTPVKLTLAGAAVMALFSSLTQGFLTMNERSLEELLFWLVGSVEGRSLDLAIPVFPFLLAGAVMALCLARAFNVLMMGDDVARGLGMNVGIIKLLGVVMIAFSAGGSVAVAGPVVFVGLIVPHLVRVLVGNDHRWLFPYCLVYGANLLLIADILGRLIMQQQPIPVGVMTALIGTPFFIYLARRKGRVRG
jgi:iron complex transport system permease protein